MEDTKLKDEQNEPRKPIGQQLTDFVAAGAGAVAETTVQSVAKSVRDVAAKKTPKPVKDAVNSFSEAASKRAAERRARS